MVVPESLEELPLLLQAVARRAIEAAPTTAAANLLWREKFTGNSFVCVDYRGWFHESALSVKRESALMTCIRVGTSPGICQASASFALFRRLYGGRRATIPA
jgi:hypothetical protein